MADERLGASFTIDVTQLKAGLKTANKLIRESQSEFKKAAAGLDDWRKSEEGLTAKIKSLNQITKLQEEKVSALKKQYQQLVDDGMDEASDRAVELRTKINQEEAALESNRAELKRQEEALDAVKNASDEAGDEIEQTGEQAEKSSGGFTVLKGALANLVADGFRAAIAKAKEFTKEIVNVGMTFDSSMSQVAAVSGATADDLEKLRDKAKQMGSTTKFTASEAADAFNYMAMAGWKTEDMLGGIDGILNLAAASGSDLATTSDIVTDALTAMGYSAKDAGRLADVMAAASSNANTNVEMMGQTFQYAAPIVGALGYSMEDTAVAIGLMANAGIKGEKSGTALRSILTRLSAPPKECADAMTALGISITKTDGTMKSLDEIMGDLRKSFDGLSETEQTANAKAIAGQEAMSGLLAIVNAAPADFDKLTKAVEQSDGAASQMANTMLDNLGGDMTVLKSQIEGVQLTLYERFEPTLRKVIGSVQKWISKVDWNAFGKKAVKAFNSVMDTGKKLAKSILPMLKTALTVVGKAVKFVADNFNVLAPAVLTVVTAFKAFKAVMAVTTAITAAQTAVAGLTAGVGLATKAQVAWNAAMSANPIGAVITAVALLATGIAWLVGSLNDAETSTDYLTESQRKSVDASKEAADAFRDQKAASDELASANIASVEYVEKNLLPQLQNLIDANGEVKAGEEARAQFILGRLNEALGTEYNNLSEIIDANGKIKQSIYDNIEAKKAQILLEAYEDEYKTALEATADAQNRVAIEAQGLAQADAELLAVKNEIAQAEADWNKAMQENSYWDAYNADQAKQNAEERLAIVQKSYDEQKAAYDSAAADAQMYYNTIDAYESASQAALEGNTQKAVDALHKYGSGFKTAASLVKESEEEKKRILGEQAINTEITLQSMLADYEKYSGDMTEEEKKQAQARIENARQQAKDAKIEFKAVGGDMVWGLAQGAEEEGWLLNKTMQKIVDDAVKAAKKEAESNSPSKRFRREVGKPIGQGIALGVKDTTKNVVGAVKQQVQAIRNAYDLDGFAPSVNAGMELNSQSGAGGGNKSVIVNQVNHYSQAHSRYELYKSKQQTAAAVRLAMGTV